MIPLPEDRKVSDLTFINIPQLRDDCIKAARSQDAVALFQLDNKPLYINFLDAFIVTQALMGPAFKGCSREGVPHYQHNALRDIIHKDIIRLNPAACMAVWLTLDEFRWHQSIPFLDDTKYPNAPGTDYSYGLVSDTTFHPPIIRGLSFILGSEEQKREFRQQWYNTKGCQVFARNAIDGMRELTYKEKCQLVPPSVF